MDEDKISYEDYEILGMYCNELYIRNEDNQIYSDDNLKYLLDSMDYFLKADELNPISKSVTLASTKLPLTTIVGSLPISSNKLPFKGAFL